MTRFVVCGEALIDLIPTGAGSTLASDWVAQSAGGPMNTAIALARLDHEVEFLGRLGDDAFAAQLRSHLAANGVGTTVAVAASAPTSLAIVSLDAAGKASYTFHFAGSANFGWTPADLPSLAADDWLHVASLVSVVDPGAEPLLAWVRAGRGPLSFDVNVRPSVLPDPQEYWARVEPWLVAVGERGGLVKGSDEDFAYVAGPGRLPADPEELALTLQGRYGVRTVAITLGGEGALAASDDEVVRATTSPITLVDTIGAGDTFMAGLLSGLVADGLSLQRSLQRAVDAAALVCTRQGANPPTRDEVAAMG